MNEKLQYASMLEMPSVSSTITKKPIKKRKLKKAKSLTPEAVKQELLDKVNSTAEQPIEKDTTQPLDSIQEPMQEEIEQEQSSIIKPKQKKAFKFSFVGLQVVVVCALIAVIAVTNVLNENSGINVFMRSLFSNTDTIVDQREFDEFSPVFGLSSNQSLVLEEGVAKFSGEGSVYSPCDAIVESIDATEDGLYSLTLSHSQNFSSKIEGLKFVYASVGQKVYSNIPVGYVDNSATLCFFDSERALITGYEIIDNIVVWAV